MRGESKIVGVIDVGSNSIRLVLFELRDEVRCFDGLDGYKVLFNHKIVAGLSAYVHDGVMSEAGVKKAMRTLRKQHQEAELFGCGRLDVFATAALRQCRNSLEAIRTIEKGTGLEITILSEKEEAHLSYVGAAASSDLTEGVFVDIGGGSAEIIGIRKGRDEAGISIPHGALSIFRDHTSGFFPTIDEEAIIRSVVREEVQAECDRLESLGCLGKTCYATGGSMRAALRLVGELVTDPAGERVIRREDLRFLIDASQEDAFTFGHHLFQRLPERSMTVIPACIVIDELLALFGCDHLTVCKGGVREGYLLERMSKR